MGRTQRKEKKKKDFLTVATDAQLNKMQNGGKRKRALGDQVSNILYLQGSVDMKWEKHILFLSLTHSLFFLLKRNKKKTVCIRIKIVCNTSSYHLTLFFL